MELLIDDVDGMAVVRPSLRELLLSRVLAARWDRRLAAGEPPEQDVRLALRARRLVAADTRQSLADSLRRLLEEAVHGRRRPGGALPPLAPQCRLRILAAASELEQVILAVQHPGPVSSQGLAALCLLIRDGAGPLYGRGSAGELRERLQACRQQLRPLSIW